MRQSYVPGCKPISEETKPSDFESNEKEITFGKTIENANPWGTVQCASIESVKRPSLCYV